MYTAFLQGGRHAKSLEDFTIFIALSITSFATAYPVTSSEPEPSPKAQVV
jgi:hypothetical protein